MGKDLGEIVGRPTGHRLELERNMGILALPASNVEVPVILHPAVPLIALVGVDAQRDGVLARWLGSDDHRLLDDLFDLNFLLDNLFDLDGLLDDFFDLDNLWLTGGNENSWEPAGVPACLDASSDHISSLLVWFGRRSLGWPADVRLHDCVRTLCAL